MIDLPTGRQTFDFDCGAKALQLALAYYGIDVREDKLLEELKCDYHGTPVKKMVAVAERMGFQVFAKSGLSLETVKQYVDASNPVIVLVQAWADRYMTLEDWRNASEHGHYVIVIGHHGNTVVFQDPSSFPRTWLTEDEFIARWHAIDDSNQGNLERFGMVLLGKEPIGKQLVHMD